MFATRVVVEVPWIWWSGVTASSMDCVILPFPTSKPINTSSSVALTSSAHRLVSGLRGSGLPKRCVYPNVGSAFAINCCLTNWWSLLSPVCLSLASAPVDTAAANNPRAHLCLGNIICASRSAFCLRNWSVNPAATGF